MGIGITDWHNKTPTEQAFYAGHFRRFPHGDPFAHALLAEILVMLARFMGVKRLPEGAQPPPADPLAVKMTDFAWWLRNSAFDIKPAETSEADRNKLAASSVLMALGVRVRQPQTETGTGNADRRQPEDAEATG